MKNLDWRDNKLENKIKSLSLIDSAASRVQLELTKKLPLFYNSIPNSKIGIDKFNQHYKKYNQTSS